MPQRDMARERDTARATTAATASPGVAGAPDDDVAGHRSPGVASPDLHAPASAPAAPPRPAETPEARENPEPPAEPQPPEPPLDARAIARASLAAGRSPSLWWACTGIVVSVVVTVVVGATPGALVLAAVLAVSAVARAVLRPAPVALTVRSRALDSVVLAGLAVGVGLLAQIIPTR